MQAMRINPRYTFALDDAVERDDDSATFDFILTDDLEAEIEELTQAGGYTTPNRGGWIMLDVSPN